MEEVVTHERASAHLEQYIVFLDSCLSLSLPFCTASSLSRFLFSSLFLRGCHLSVVEISPRHHDVQQTDRTLGNKCEGLTIGVTLSIDITNPRPKRLSEEFLFFP